MAAKIAFLWLPAAALAKALPDPETRYAVASALEQLRPRDRGVQLEAIAAGKDAAAKRARTVLEALRREAAR